MSAEYFEEQRRQLIAAIRANTDQVAAQIGKAALDKRVLGAMAKVPRHEFVPVEAQPYAYLNMPLPIGFDKTISQPLMVAVMTDLLELKSDDVVLEIGTGLGYQAAVLAELAGRVYSVEIIDELAQRAVQRLKRQGYTNIEVRVGNGYSGWPEHAPFDKVIVTAAPDLIPPPLINQLKAGGRMVIPVGLPNAQQLVVAEKDLNGRVKTKEIMRVMFSLLEESDQPAFRRIPMYSPNPRAKRVEFRTPDPSCNGYLAFAAMLMAGLDGIEKRIDPGEPIDKNLYDLPPAEAKAVKSTPGSLQEALDALEADHGFLLRGDVFTKDVIETWLSYKRKKEVDAIALRPHPYEFHLYYDI